MKKNVLFVVDEKQMGGVSVLLQDILNNINVSKYNVDVLVLHNVGNYLDKLPKSVNIIYGTDFFEAVDLTIKEALKTKNIKTIFSKVRLIYLMKTKSIKKYIVRERERMLSKKYDVEIAFKDGFSALITAYGDSRKKYHWLHTDYSMYDCTGNYKPLFDEVFPVFDKIIAISNSVLDRFKEKYSVDKTDVIFNIIDENKIINASLEEEVKYDKDKLNLVSVGRIHSMKGYDRLVEVIHRLDKEGKLEDVVTRIIGDGPDFELLKKKVCEYDLSSKVILMGKKKNPFVYVKSSDCFLMCSRYEAFGLVVLESLALKVPVLSCDVASIREIMDTKYGMIVDNSEEGLYNGLLKIIEDRKILKETKRNLKEYKYNIDKILVQIESLLDEE